MYTLIFPYDCTLKIAAFVCYYEGMTSPGCINERRVDPRSMSAAYVALLLLLFPFQLQEYQTDMGPILWGGIGLIVDTLGKLTPAYSAGPPTVRGLWVCPARWVSAFLTAAGPPTVRGTFYCP